MSLFAAARNERRRRFQEFFKLLATKLLYVLRYGDRKRVFIKGLYLDNFMICLRYAVCLALIEIRHEISLVITNLLMQ